MLLRKRPVSATYLKRARSSLGLVNNLAMLISLPPMLFRSTCLASWCAGQCKMKCCIVSEFCRHEGQMGESAFFIRWRCLAKGACPVLNWVRMVESFLGSFDVSLRNLSDVDVGSVLFILS